MKIRAIVFDYFGVLAGEPALYFNKKISEIIGVDTKKIKIIYHKYNDLHNTGKITWDELWARVLGDLDKLSSLDEVIKFVKTPKKINLNVISLVKELKEKGLIVALLSNYSREGGKRMREKEHLDKIFDPMLISAETGLAKPHPEAFYDLLKKLNLKPSEVLFIDDARINIKSAQKIGINTILCRDTDKLKTLLEKRGIL
ncbi:MAG TPA: HAD family phosphatase [Candidatus Methanoperedens sp.]|nr:HAD family phosphatase [Candidatus Methanoperedens sp.]